MELNSPSQIIERAEFLSPDIVPQKITGRCQEVEKLRWCLRPMEKGLAPISAWLYGPAGSGKTVVARKVAEEGCCSGERIALYVNCWERPTLYSVVQELCEQLGTLGAAAQDTNLKLTRLRQSLKEKAVLIILDEIDRPAPKQRESIIYQLLQLPRTGLFCISLDASTFFNLETRIRSKLAPTQLHLARYSTPNVKAILAERALDALAPNAYTGSLLQRIAFLARGDATAALHILLRSAVAAEANRAGRISTKHIPADALAWQRLQKRSRIEAFPEHQQLIYRLAKKHGQISYTKLRKLYLTRCHNQSIEPVAQRTFTKYLQLLARGNFINIEAQAVGGRGRLVKVVV